MKSARTWIVVHDGLPDHPKIEALSDKAFRALLTLWCWSSRQLTDGHVPKAAWQKRTTPGVRRELISGGLVELLDGGDVAMHDFLDWQRSAADVAAASEKKQTASKLGNHKRWHVKEGRPDPSCEYCQHDPPPIPSGIPDGIADEIPNESQRDPRGEERRGEEKGGGYVGRGAPAAREPRNDPPQDPTRCENHVDHPDPPPCGRCADLRRHVNDQRAADRRARRGAIDACTICDENGLRERDLDGVERCDHRPAAVAS